MDRILKLIGLKKPDLNEAMPENDDIDSKGMTQYFNIPIGGLRLPGDSASIISGGTAGKSTIYEDNDPYRDVNLRVHVRLLKKQNNMKVRLHVKVDPEETDNWIIPEKGNTQGMYFNGDEPFYPYTTRMPRVDEVSVEEDKFSVGYHSQSSTSVAEMGKVEREFIPIVQEDDAFRFLMDQLGTQKDDYDTTKMELSEFVYSKVLRNTVASDVVKEYSFNKICLILRDYFRHMGIKIANTGDLVFFEKQPKKKKAKKKKGMGSMDLLSQLPEEGKAGESGQQEFSTRKKHCKEAIELYTELEERFINYRAVYYEAVEHYDVQVIESRFGYHMCEMQEELIMGNMILSGQVVPD